MLHFVKLFIMEKLSISIPKPCHENWDAMLPEEKGRFCQSCAKTVIDFTQSSNAEITSYFQNNRGLKTCGRFNKEQLKSVKIEIPEHLIYQQTSFRKAFLLALFIAMGSTLFSCKDENNTIHPLGEIVVVEDSLTNSKDTLIESFNSKDTLAGKTKKNCTKYIPKPIPHLLGIIEVEPENRKEEIMGDVMEVPQEIVVPKIYNIAEVEKIPAFSTDENEFRKYIIQNINLPDTIENLKAIVQFVIDSDGNLTDIKIVRGENEALNNQIISLLQNSPAWSPGEIRGKKVNVRMTYPIRIKPQ